MKRKHRIYKITCLETDKCYIGQTVNTIEERLKQHFKKSKLNNSHCKLSNAIKKYGSENFVIELLEDNINGDLIDKKEIEYIEKYETLNKGYNTSRGGDSKYINELDQEKIIKLYEGGSSSSKLANMFNASSTTILRILYANGIKRRIDKNKGKEIKEDFIKMYINKEYKTSEIAKQFEISIYSVRRWGRKFNLPHRER